MREMALWRVCGGLVAALLGAGCVTTRSFEAVGTWEASEDGLTFTSTTHKMRLHFKDPRWLVVVNPQRLSPDVQAAWKLPTADDATTALLYADVPAVMAAMLLLEPMPSALTASELLALMSNHHKEHPAAGQRPPMLTTRDGRDVILQRASGSAGQGERFEVLRATLVRGTQSFVLAFSAPEAIFATKEEEFMAILDSVELLADAPVAAAQTSSVSVGILVPARRAADAVPYYVVNLRQALLESRQGQEAKARLKAVFDERQKGLTAAENRLKAAIDGGKEDRAEVSRRLGELRMRFNGLQQEMAADEKVELSKLVEAAKAKVAAAPLGGTPQLLLERWRGGRIQSCDATAWLRALLDDEALPAPPASCRAGSVYALEVDELSSEQAFLLVQAVRAHEAMFVDDGAPGLCSAVPWLRAHDKGQTPNPAWPPACGEAPAAE